MVDLADVHHAVVGGDVGLDAFGRTHVQIELGDGELVGVRCHLLEDARMDNLQAAESQQGVALANLDFARGDIRPATQVSLFETEVALRLARRDYQ